MATAAAHTFDRLIAQLRAVFDQVVVARDEKPTHVHLELTATHGPYRLRLVETVTPAGQRKYAYYVLQADEVIVGFDNAPDPRALSLKYGADYTQHRLEAVPHCHTHNKTSLSLTEEMDGEQFISWVQTHLSAPQGIG